MAWRDATPEEVAQMQSWREPTPEELALIQGSETSPVRPGDVEAAKARYGVEGDVATGFRPAPGSQPENVARERLGGDIIAPLLRGDIGTSAWNVGAGMGSEAVGGVGDILQGTYRLATTNPFQGPEQPATTLQEALANVYASPVGQAGFGALRVLGAPLAPVTDIISEGAEAAQRGLRGLGMEKSADVIAGVGQSVADVLAGFGASRLAQRVKPWATRVGVTNRQRAEAATTKAAREATESEQRVAALQKRKEALPEETVAAQESTREQLTDLGKRTRSEIEDIKANVKAGEESFESIAEAGRRELPSESTIRTRFAPDAPQGADVGAEFKKTFSTKFEESRAINKRTYQPILAKAATIETDASNFAKAGGVLEKPAGITGAYKTKPEGLASRIKQRLAGLDELDDDTYDAIKQQLEAAPDNATAKAAFDEFIVNNNLPKRPTVADLIIERQRLKSGWRATRDDNSRRQINDLVDALEEDIAKGSTSVAEDLFTADARVAKEHAPYYSRGSVTRAIAEGKPETVVDAIFRPTVSESGRVLKNNAPEAMSRARELITDPKQWDNVRKAFTNKLIQGSFKDGIFDPNKFAKNWSRYLDPANTNNVVLRTGLGEEMFRDMQTTIRQLQHAKVYSFDDMVREQTKGLRQFGERAAEGVRARAGVEREGLVRELRQTGQAGARRGRELSQEISTEKLAQKQIARQLEDDVTRWMGSKGWEDTSKRLRGIGAGIFASGAVSADITRMGRGGWIAVSADLVAKLLQTQKGRNWLRTLARSTPGAANNAALYRQGTVLANQAREEE
jgi:hypothetical protein